MCVFAVQYKLHASTEAVAPTAPEDASDDSVDIDMEKLKAEAKEVAYLTSRFTVPGVNAKSCVLYTFYIWRQFKFGPV